MRLCLKVLCVALSIFYCTPGFGIDYVWRGTTSRSWTTASNWTPSGVPGPADNVAIRSAPFSPLMSTSRTVTDFAIISGDLNLNGFTLTITGDTFFDGGTINNGTVNCTGLISIFQGTTFGAVVTATSEEIELNGSIFNNTAHFTSSNPTGNTSEGGNTFNSTVTITHNGEGGIVLDGDLGENETDALSPNIFNGDVTFTNTAGGSVSSGSSSGNQFNGNVVVNNTGSGSINLGRATLAATRTLSVGSPGFTSGFLTLSDFTQLGATAQLLSLTGTAYLRVFSSVFNGNVNFIAPYFELATSTYHGVTALTRTGAFGHNVQGGNTFNAATTITNTSASGSVSFANINPDVFNAEVMIINNLSGLITFDVGCEFNGDVTLSNNAGGTIIMSSLGTSETHYNGNIILNSTGSSGDIFLGLGLGGSPSRLAATKTISIGSGGFDSGLLYFSDFIQEGPAAQAFTLTGTATLRITSSVFNGDVNFSAPQLFLESGTFNGITSLQKSGAGSNISGGGNIFNAATTIVNSGSGDLTLARNLPDIFNGNATITNTGSASVYIANGSAGNQFNGNVTLTNTGSGNATTGIFNNSAGSGTTAYNGNIIVNNTSAGGISIGNNSGSVIILADTRTISEGATGFTNGTLSISNFTQTGAATQTLTLTGTAALRLNEAVTFNGSVNLTAPQIFLTGCTFNGMARIEKTGANQNVSRGNVFNSTTTLLCSGSGDLIMGNGQIDIFNGELTVINTGTSFIHLAYSSTGNQFNGNIILNQTTGAGIQFGQTSGTSTLADGRTITSTGISSGVLTLSRFTQVGSASQNLTLTGTALLQLGPATTFNGNVDFTSSRLSLTGCTFNGNTALTKSGSDTNASSGTNSFNGPTTLTNTGSGSFDLSGILRFSGDLIINNSGTSRFLIGTGAGCLFNGNVTVNHQGNSTLSTVIANGGSATISGNLGLHSANANAGSGIIIGNGGNVTINGNITVSSSSGRGVYFGDPTGVVTLGNGYSITATPGAFLAGALSLRAVVLPGNAARQIALSGTASLILTSLIFGGPADFSAPQIFFSGCTFSDVARIEKTGADDNISSGNNLFNASATIVNSGTGLLRLGNTSGDTFRENVTFIKTGSGELEPAYGANGGFSALLGDVTVNSTTSITFGAGAGGVLFRGPDAQFINKTGAANPTFTRIVAFKTMSDITLNTAITVTSLLAFSTGIIHSSNANLLTLSDNATCSGASHTSYVSGPIRKTGDEAFTFPVGKNGFYRPIAISAPGSVTDHFTAEYFEADPDAAYPAVSKDPAIDHVSRCEYWIIDRTNGTSGVTVTLSWDINSCGVDDLSALRVARWDGVAWQDHGNGATTGTTASGTISSSGNVIDFSPFALASSTLSNPLPVELLKFTAEPNGHHIEISWSTASEKNNDYFLPEKSLDGIHFETIEKVSGAGNSNSIRHYGIKDYTPHPGISYYRLRQVDFDGQYKNSDVISVEFINAAGFSFTVFPNPSGDHAHLAFAGISDENDEIKILVYDIHGREVFFKTMRTSHLKNGSAGMEDLSGLPAGAYFIVATFGLVKYEQRLFITR